MASDAIYVVTLSDYYYPGSGAEDVIGVFSTLDDAEECYRDTAIRVRGGLKYQVAFVLEFEPDRVPVTVWCSDD